MLRRTLKYGTSANFANFVSVDKSLMLISNWSWKRDLCNNQLECGVVFKWVFKSSMLDITKVTSSLEIKMLLRMRQSRKQWHMTHLSDKTMVDVSYSLNVTIVALVFGQGCLNFATFL